jgi:hypothetical protein
MRCLYFACASLSLFFCDHAQARIGETYRESVKRYEAAGFKKTRTTFTAPENDKGLGYCSLPHEYWDFKPERRFRFLHVGGVYGIADVKHNIRAGCTELTWSKSLGHSGGEVQVVKIYQVFFGQWTHSKSHNPWQDVLHCIEIYYTFKDKVDKSSQTYKSWRDSLFNVQNRNKRRGESLHLEEDIDGSSKTLHIRFDHTEPWVYRKDRLYTSMHPGYVWDTIANKKKKIDAARKPPPQQEFNNSGL